MPEAIFQSVQRDNLLEDIKARLENEYFYDDIMDEHDLTLEEVLADKSMMSEIVGHYYNYEGKSDYWSTIDLAITDGINATLDARKETSQ